jgi:hypothetical protein
VDLSAGEGSDGSDNSNNSNKGTNSGRSKKPKKRRASDSSDDNAGDFFENDGWLVPVKTGAAAGAKKAGSSEAGSDASGSDARGSHAEGSDAHAERSDAHAERSDGGDQPQRRRKKKKKKRKRRAASEASLSEEDYLLLEEGAGFKKRQLGLKRLKKGARLPAAAGSDAGTGDGAAAVKTEKDAVRGMLFDDSSSEDGAGRGGSGGARRGRSDSPGGDGDMMRSGVKAEEAEEWSYVTESEDEFDGFIVDEDQNSDENAPKRWRRRVKGSKGKRAEEGACIGFVFVLFFFCFLFFTFLPKPPVCILHDPSCWFMFRSFQSPCWIKNRNAWYIPFAAPGIASMGFSLGGFFCPPTNLGKKKN